MAVQGTPLPRVVADGPLAPAIEQLLFGQVEWLPWSTLQQVSAQGIDAIYTYGHPDLNGEMLDRCPGLKVISNYGVGVDHINLRDASQRGIPVGNTPGILDQATADLGFALLLAAGRRLVEGDRYARSHEFTRYDPGYMLGREIHGATLGIVGMGRIGEQVARRARGFDMTVLYRNRRRREAVERELGVRPVPFDQLLAEADYVMLCVPLTEQTRGLIGRSALQQMKPTATLVNISRGQVVDTEALAEALKRKQIFAAALDVTDPEPLPRNHTLLQLSSCIVTPHLGSATVQTRQIMAEVSVANLRAGLRGERLLHQVIPPDQS